MKNLSRPSSNRPTLTRILPSGTLIGGYGPQMLAVLYVIVTTLYAVFAFRNFSSFEVFAVLFLFSALPLGLIFLGVAPGKNWRPRKRWWSFLVASIVAPVIFFLQFSGLSRLSHLYSNFPNHRMDFDEPGFHQDTAFHVAIIQGILNNGYPTTGQHLEPWVSYHALSHYVDAIALFLLGLDPWESYALFFFAKGVAISLAVIFFSMKVAEKKSESVFWLTLAIVYPAFTATWHVISSHGQWFPMLILALVAYKVFEIAMKPRRTWPDYLLLTVLVIVFSLGKVSLGFTFAVVVGFWLLFRRPIDWRLLLSGAVWVAFLAAYSIVVFYREPSGLDAPSLGSRFGFALQNVSAVFLVAVVIAVIARATKAKYGMALSAALVGALTVTAVAVNLAETNGSDVWYFFHGLFSVALFFSVAFTARTLLPDSEARQSAATSEVFPLKMLAFGGALLFAVSPLTSTSVVSPYSSVGTIWAIASTVNNHTYTWSNEGAGSGERLTTWEALTGKSLRIEDPAESPWSTQFRDSLDEFLDSQALSDASPLLFLTSEQFDFVSDRISPPTPWSTGLAVTAVTGMPLVFGVSGPATWYYGLNDYGEDARVLPQSSAAEKIVCNFDRPVVILSNIEVLTFGVLC